MKELFWPMLFLLLEIQIPLGNLTLDLLPDFVGCILLIRMVPGLERSNRKLLGILALCSAAFWILKLPEMPTLWDFAVWLLGLGVSVIRILTVRRLIHKASGNPAAQNLWSYWAVTEIFCRLCSWIPVVGTVTAVASLLMGSCLLAACFRRKMAAE